MQSNPQKIWIPNPSAALVEAGLNPGEVRIVDQMSILDLSVTACNITCASPCTEEVWTIEFPDVDFGTCNDCGKTVGFQLQLLRNPDFDNQTYFEYAMKKVYVYQDLAAGTVTGTTLATYFEDYINELYNQNDQHDQFHISVTRVGDTLTITLPCSGLVTYRLQGIFQIQDNNLLSSEQPIFTLVTPGVDAVLSRERLLQQFPQEVGHVFGEAPRDQFMWCQTVCVIYLRGCIDACSDWYDNQNSGFLHTGATRFDLYLYVNSAAPGFAAFIGQLNLLISACGSGPGLPTTGGYQSGVRGATSGAVDISSLEFDSVNGTAYSVTVGAVTIVVTATSGSDLATQIDAAWPGTLSVVTYTAGPPATLTFIGTFAAAGAFVTISPMTYTNLVGE